MKQVLLTVSALLMLSSCTVKTGTETYIVRENKLGTAVVPMEDVEVLALQLQEDGTVVRRKVTIKTRTVIRVGIEFIARADQILTLEPVKFQAIVPDATGKLVKSDVMTVDANTAIKIGTTTFTPEVEPTK